MFEYPYVYVFADEKSTIMQRLYLRLLILEYFLLFCTAANSFLSYQEKYTTSAILLFFLMILLFVKMKFSSSSDWYKYRALAESIKTMSWRYSMKSSPFNSGDDLKDYKKYQVFLEEILKDSNYIPRKVSGNVLTKNNFTGSMKTTREMSWEDRKEFYLTHRILNQWEWYRSKSTYNSNMAKKWWRGILVLYLFAFFTSLYNIWFNDYFIFPVSVLTTLASSLLGWSQIKRFNELSSSYLLTSGEIGLMKEQVNYIYTQDSFSDFVNESELAFSREHTQWEARRK
ncbi:DUF4231 domain-containing protein [Candidatus Pantoea rara]|uniref:DUF4231 domain-containing protein n=1 Tax=Candidatus Pantoea rara TaxID=1947037 RepID=UPI003EBFDD9C